MNNKNSLILFIFLLIINSVNAFDLVSVSEKEKSVCPSSTILLNAKVIGTGNFNVNADGSASKWATVVPQGFILNNEAKLIYSYITPKFDTNPGLYDLNLMVTSGNEVKNINYKINVPDCHNLEITGTASKSICGCNSDVYEFTISNNGIYQESYEIEVNGKAASWIKLNQNSLTLTPGESKTIYASLNAPCGSDFGENKFTVTVRSLISNSIASFDSNVIVNSCFDFDVNAEKEFLSMCEHSSEVIPIKINNLAELDNNFDLKITGPAWANLHLSKLDLSSKNSGIINLILSPDYKVEGDFDININIKSKQSKISKDVKVKVSIRKCNDVSFELLTKEDRICAGSKKYHEANIKNLGELEKDFRIETSQGWAKPEEIIIKLAQGESKKIKIEFNPDENLTAKNYNINFKALALDSSKVNSEDSFNLDLLTRNDCYKPELQVQDLEVNTDSSATAQIAIKNIGAEIAVYELGLSGNANTFSQLNPSIVTVDPGKSEIVYLYVAPPYNIKQGDYKANIFVNLKNLGILESKTINIKVGEGKSVETVEVNKTNLFEKLFSFIKKLNINQTQEQFIDIEKENMIKNDVKFSFNNDIHSLKIFDVKNNSVTLIIESEQSFVLLDLNETEEVDIDKDGKNDLILKLEGFDENNKPIINVNKKENNSNQISNLNYLKDIFDRYKAVMLIILIIIIGAILFFSMGLHKKLIDLFEEETDQEIEEKPLKIGRYVILIIILIALFWYFRTYSNKWQLVLNYLNIYKMYIIAGLIILILLILIITYWKDIIDFFGEKTDNK